MSVRKAFLSLTILLVLAAGQVMAQRPERGGRFGGFGGFGGPSRLALLRVDEVQQELNLTSDQIQAIQELGRELRGGPEGPGAGGADFRDLSPEERRELLEQRRAQAAERAQKERAGLAEILKPEQATRLTGILIQVAGTAALEDAEVAAQVGISEQQQNQIREARRTANQELREQLREAFQSGDREAVRAKMAELRRAADERVLAVLTTDQREKLEQLKGAPFELPEGALGRGFFGPGGRQGGPGRRGERGAT